MTGERPSLLWHSNSPYAPTGYGQQTAAFARALNEDYRLGISAFYGLEANIIPWNGIPLYPGIGGTHGDQTILEHAKIHHGEPRGGLTVTLMDVWVLDPAIWRQLDLACWVPVDHEPAPRPVVQFFEQTSAVPIAMAKFGEEQLRNAGLDPLYCPHAVDTQVYTPQDKAEARRELEMPEDAFLVGMVAANKGNPSRKCFSEAFQAFKAFREQHPEAMLYLHTEATGRFQGVDLPRLIRDIGIDPATVFFPDQYRVLHYPYPPEKMAKVFSSFDVLLAPSAGEGFGIPVIEAQACGTPVIASDFTAQPELVGAGWLVSGHRTYTPMQAWQFVPDVEDIYDALKRSYAVPAAQRKGMGQKAVNFASGYDVRTVLKDYMLPALAEAQKRIADREPVELAA